MEQKPATFSGLHNGNDLHDAQRVQSFTYSTKSLCEFYMFSNNDSENIFHGAPSIKKSLIINIQIESEIKLRMMTMLKQINTSLIGKMSMHQFQDQI